MSLSFSEASGVVRSIGAPFLFNPDVPGLTEFSANKLSIGSVFMNDVGLDTLDFGTLCFLALELTAALGLDVGSCLASLLLA